MKLKKALVEDYLGNGDHITGYGVLSCNTLEDVLDLVVILGKSYRIRDGICYKDPNNVKRELELGKVLVFKINTLERRFDIVSEDLLAGKMYKNIFGKSYLPVSNKNQVVLYSSVLLDLGIMLSECDKEPNNYEGGYYIILNPDTDTFDIVLTKPENGVSKVNISIPSNYNPSVSNCSFILSKLSSCLSNFSNLIPKISPIDYNDCRDIVSNSLRCRIYIRGELRKLLGSGYSCMTVHPSISELIDILGISENCVYRVSEDSLRISAAIVELIIKFYGEEFCK